MGKRRARRNPPLRGRRSKSSNTCRTSTLLEVQQIHMCSGSSLPHATSLHHSSHRGVYSRLWVGTTTGSGGAKRTSVSKSKHKSKTKQLGKKKKEKKEEKDSDEKKKKGNGKRRATKKPVCMRV